MKVSANLSIGYLLKRAISLFQRPDVEIFQFPLALRRVLLPADMRKAPHQARHQLGELFELACRAAASIRRRSRSCAAAHRSGSRRAAARRHCRRRCRPPPACRPRASTALSFSAAISAGSTSSPASWRIRRSDNFSLRGRLPTWVVRMRSRLKIMKFAPFRLSSSRQKRLCSGRRSRTRVADLAARKYAALLSASFGGHNTHSPGRKQQ